jgi:hypothetical protein
LKFLGEVWAGRACAEANQQELATLRARGRIFFAKGEFRAPGHGSQSNRLWASSPLLAIFSFFSFFLDVMRMGLAFWENGCTSPPFFEACPYTWKCEIFHSSWSLEISIFSKSFFAKIKIHVDLHIRCWNFNFMKK